MDRRVFLTAVGALPIQAAMRDVISGHTHKFDWRPATDAQPLGQLIGGRPVAKIATIIHGLATRNELRLTMKKLDGTVVAEVKLNA